MSVEVPKWKQDLILKKQQWKSQGGWSVPPHPVCATLRTIKPTVSANFERQTDGFPSPNGPTCKLSDSPKKRPTLSRKTDPLDLADGEVFGSVSDLKAIFQPPNEDLQPMTKSRSVENILEETPIPNISRRASTSNDFAQEPKFGLPKKFRAVPSMEDFLKRYRKTTVKKVPVLLDSHKHVQADKNGRKEKTIYFVDMNKNELPTPNTVKETVRAFEDPLNSKENIEKPVPEGITYKTRDVVQQFEAKIKSQPIPEPQFPPKPSSALKIDIQKTGKRADSVPKQEFGETRSSTERDFEKIGNFSPQNRFSTDPRIFNVFTSDPTTVANGMNSTNEEKIANLKTVTINSNQSVIIKTI